MTTWTYRVMRQEVGGEVIFQIYEVYFKDGVADCWTEDSCAVMYNETTDDNWSLKKAFEQQMEALDLPVLDHDTGEEIK